MYGRGQRGRPRVAQGKALLTELKVGKASLLVMGNLGKSIGRAAHSRHLNTSRYPV